LQCTDASYYGCSNMVATAQSRNILYAGKKTLNMNPVLNKLKLCQLVICLMSYLLIHIFWVFERAASSDLYLLQSKGSTYV